VREELTHRGCQRPSARGHSKNTLRAQHKSVGLRARLDGNHEPPRVTPPTEVKTIGDRDRSRSRLSRTRLNRAAGNQIRSPSTSARAVMRNRRRTALRPRRTRKMTLARPGASRTWSRSSNSERSELEAAFRRVDEDPTEQRCSRIESDRGDAEEPEHIAKLRDRPLGDVRAALKRAARGSRPGKRPPDYERVDGGDQAAMSFTVAVTQARREDRAGRPHGRRSAGPPLPAVD
jgi:hypothetical protein